jgi:two-component system, cell cycle response regulator
VLAPLALGFVALCAWLLRMYRRRSEAAMLAALELSSREARTDQLTGLANRRALLEELERRTKNEQPFVLALADLDGFKQYNDTFGHAAGDALLHRLGGKLNSGCAGRGTAARLGGDEFCLLLPAGTPGEEVEALVHGTLTEEGEGFHITAGCGVVRVPEDTGTAEGALRLADSRMYATKMASRPTVEHVMSRALIRMLDERHPGLGDHVEEVSSLAAACAGALGLSEDDVGQVRRAAELHDIGKLAIPESIIRKPGPLTADEWDFVRRHTVIGERVLAVVPSLQRAAALVRASHERWDGTGYPDQLAGERIPLGARIVAVADAFSAMTEGRPHAAARTVDSALAELRACAGTQFDPAVVDAFVAAIGAGARGGALVA